MFYLKVSFSAKNYRWHLSVQMVQVSLIDISSLMELLHFDRTTMTSKRHYSTFRYHSTLCKYRRTRYRNNLSPRFYKCCVIRIVFVVDSNAVLFNRVRINNWQQAHVDSCTTANQLCAQSWTKLYAKFLCQVRIIIKII